MKSRSPLRAGAWLALCALAACKPGGSGSDGGADGGGPGYYTCQVDPAALDRGADCLWDDSCPCGTYCKLGACAADCRGAGDCGDGKACDGFGRCVAVSTSASSTAALGVAPPVLDAPQGTVVLEGVPLQLDAQHTLGVVTVRARGAAVDALRLEAGAGVELQCAPMGAFAASCALDALPADAARAVTVRVTDPSAAGTFEVRLVSAREAQAFRVRYAKDTAVAAQPLEGVYQGFAHPVAFGSVARSTTSVLPAAMSELSVPVTITVYPEVAGRRIVELSDSLGVVFPDDKTVGELLRATDNSLLLRHGSRAWVGAGAGGSAQVDVAVSGESLAVEKGASGLALTLRQRYSGVLDTADEPFVTWQLSLGRQGDLPAGAVAPALPAPYVPADAPARAAQPLAAETAVEQALATPLAAVTPQTPAELAQAVICTPYGAATATKLDAVLGSPWSGDLACTGGTTTPAPQLDFGLLKESTWQLATTLTNCMADLRNGQAVAAGTLSPAPSQGCLDSPRAISAIHQALDLDRRRALGENVSPDPTASALAHRLLQQWLRTHLFVAKQATQVDLLNDILANEAQVSRGFRQIDMLELTGAGFDLLLTPRVAMGLSRLMPQVVFAPDYRPRLAPSLALPANPRHEMTTGLPVTMVDALQQGLGVYAALYERARYVTADRPALEASAKGFLRKSLVLMALASTINDVTRAGNVSPPSWDLQWTRQTGLYGIAVAGLLRSIDNLRRGENPLGLDDKLDLPLYRVGDQVGSLARFSAVSDYLLGTGTTLDNSAIVPARILEAETALEAARTAWTQNLQQDFVQAQENSAAAARQEAVRRRYGEQVSSLCGDPNMDSATVLDSAASIDPDTCFVKPECRQSPAARRALMAPGEVAGVLCLAAGVRERLGASASPALAQGFNPAQLQPLLQGQVTVKGHAESGGSVLVTMSDGSVVSVATALFTSDSAQPVPGLLTADDLDQLRSRCEAVSGASEVARPTDPPTSCAFNGDCPGGYACVGAACKPSVDTATQTACYLGSLGELTVSIRAAAKDVDIARSELAELSQTYDLQMKKCITANLGAEQAIKATEDHNKTMSTLATVKLAADVASHAANAVGDCADAVGADTKFGVAAGVSCTSKAVAAAADSVSSGMEFAMGEAERAHDLELQRIEAQTEERTCFIEAEMSLVGTRTAVLRIERASQEVAGQLVQLENSKNDLRGALQEGQEALAAEIDRTVPPIALEFWLNDKVEVYGASFRAARRAAYLGVLAVEYEYQLSTIERQNVLAATRVSELQGVLDRLRNLVATGTVKGRVPADLHSVVSLRSNLMQLSDQSQLPAGWHTLTEAQRFQLLLTSPRFAVYGPDGAYRGQELPFRVAPLSVFKLGDPGGVALLTGGDCAERVWAVNAVLVGPDLVVGDSTRARVTLKKRNRFFSQWCSPAPAGEALQQAATRPSRNLFLDPFSDYLPGGPGSTGNPAATVDAAAEADAFTSARLQPELNVSRADFEADDYTGGASRELAGRGLYGDYALFFPAEVLARKGGDGLRLDRLTDVLLRFDYVSVAQN